jgi:hypothetical protein
MHGADRPLCVNQHGQVRLEMTDPYQVGDSLFADERKKRRAHDIRLHT